MIRGMLLTFPASRGYGLRDLLPVCIVPKAGFPLLRDNSHAASPKKAHLFLERVNARPKKTADWADQIHREETRPHAYRGVEKNRGKDRGSNGLPVLDLRDSLAGASLEPDRISQPKIFARVRIGCMKLVHS